MDVVKLEEVWLLIKVISKCISISLKALNCDVTGIKENLFYSCAINLFCSSCSGEHIY
jgi:hypothetical protein